MGQEAGLPVDTDLIDSFGYVGTATLTLFQSVSGGEDWGTFFVQMEKVGAAYAGVYIFFIAFYLIAVWNIVTSLFVNSALQMTIPDIETIQMEKRWQDLRDARDITIVLSEELDRDHSGTISKGEIEEVLCNERF